MAEQKPASEQMSDLASAAVNVGQMIQKDFVEIGRPDLAQALLAAVKQFEAQGDALYTRMQAEEQERAAMRGLLARLVAEFDPLFERYDTGPDEWLCPLCHQATPALYDPPGHLAPAPEPFPHAETCPIAQARALLQRMDTGKE